MRSTTSIDERVVVLAPTGADTVNALVVLERKEMKAVAAKGIEDLVELALEGAAVMLIAEEALASQSIRALSSLLDSQPSWSDFPIIVITSGGDSAQTNLRLFKELAPSGNITVLERPFSPLTLVSACQVGLRARRRQYQVRDLLEQQQEDKRLLETRIEERTAKLSEALTNLEAFSYTVSHDLRTPLRALQGYAGILVEELAEGLTIEHREYLERITNAANRMDHLVRDTLTYSRVANTEIELTRVDLTSLVDDVIATYPHIQQSEAAILVKRPLLEVMGHPSLLTQCISNLLGNAVKFVDPSIKPLIKVSTKKGGFFTRLYIEDNGIGISKEDEVRIFRMFERGPSSRKYEGTGIGLAIVRKAVERMGGRVGLMPARKRGSIFWIELQKV